MRLAIVVALALLASSVANAMDFKEYTFPELVATAPLIAEGSISLQQQQPVIVVDRFLKGNSGTRLSVQSPGTALMPSAQFRSGEKVILFLDTPDKEGAAQLVGFSYQGKWPQPYAIDTYTRIDLTALADVVAVVNAALTARNADEQANAIAQMIRSNDQVVQLAGLDMASSHLLSRSLPAFARGGAREHFAAVALPLLKSSNRDVRERAIRLLASAPNSVAAPALIPLITDPDLGCRRSVRASLGRVVADCKISDPDIHEWMTRLLSSDPKTPEDPDAAHIQAVLRQVWQSKKDGRLAKELPRIQANAKSSSSLESTSAAIYLQYLASPPE